MKPPTEVGTNSLLPVAASRKAMKQVDEEKCVDALTKLIKAKAQMTIPEVIRWAKQNFGMPRRRCVEDKNCCLDQARKQAKNSSGHHAVDRPDNSYQEFIPRIHTKKVSLAQFFEVDSRVI
jgi:hypothetical protein